MNTPRLFTMFVLLAALSACGGGRTELPILDLETAMNTGRQLSETFTLNDIVEVVDVIPIETRPDALIGNANLIHIGKEHLYLRHDDKISRIDRNGKIVSTIARQGRGPGEYLEPTVTDVNEAASTIRVFDRRSDKYITYDMEGTLIDEGFLNEKGVELPRFIGDDYMVVRGRRDGSYRHYITDRDMNILQGIFPMDSTLTELDRYGLTQQVGVGSSSDAALVNLTTNDTLYRVTKQGIIPEAILNKGLYRRSEQPIVQIVTPDTPPYFISTTVEAFGNYYFIRSLILGQVVEIWNKTDGRLIAHSNSGDGFDKFGFRFVFTRGGETRVSNFHFDGESVAFVVNAVNVADAIDGVKEDDNPVIIIAKIKE